MSSSSTSPPSKLHTCLVCGSSTKHAHLGILLCRACKIFYGRALSRKKPRVCRAGTNDCSHKCKHCRFAHIVRLLEGNAGRKEKREETRRKGAEPAESSLPSTSTSVAQPVEDRPSTSTDDPREPRLARLHCPAASTADHSLISRMRVGYSTMSMSRRVAELTALHPTHHPIMTFDGQFPLIPANTSTTNVTGRAVIHALFDFCRSTFDEFATLSLQQKWFLIKNFKHPFYALESAYRIHTQFPNSPPMVFMSITTFLDEENVRYFADGECSEKIRADSHKFLGMYLLGDVHRCRGAIARLAPTHDEFVALIGLFIWNLENTDADAQLVAIAAEKRKQILRELEEKYKEEKTSEYARRLGELLAVTTFFQITAEGMPFKLEMLRLHNIIDEDTFLYSMAKS